MKTTHETMAALGISMSTLRRYVSLGAPVARRKANRTFYDLDALRAWMTSRALDGTEGKPSDVRRLEALDESMDPSGPRSLGQRKLQAQTAKEAALAQWHALRLKIKKGEYVERSEVETGWALRVREVRRRLEGLTRELPPQLQGLDEPSMSAVIAARVAEICDGYANNPAVQYEVNHGNS